MFFGVVSTLFKCGCECHFTLIYEVCNVVYANALCYTGPTAFVNDREPAARVTLRSQKWIIYNFICLHHTFYVWSQLLFITKTTFATIHIQQKCIKIICWISNLLKIVEVRTLSNLNFVTSLHGVVSLGGGGTF